MKSYFKMLALSLLLSSVCAFAEEDEKEIAKAALNSFKVNRFAEHIAAPLQEYLNLDYGESKTQSILYFKPVVPFRITNHYDLIIRTIAPLYERTPTNNDMHQLGGPYVNGWGDINPTFFIAPAKFDLLVVGLGPTISIPTSTNDRYIGTGKWSVGPELGLYYMPRDWVIGLLTSNMWSVAGDPKKPAVNTFQFQYLISRVFDHGWYIASNPTITANWKALANEQWIVPFGIGGGRVVKFGAQPVNVGVFSYYNAVRPAGVGPNWQVQLQIEWMFKPTTITPGYNS